MGPTKVELLSSLLTGNHKPHHANQIAVIPSNYFFGLGREEQTVPIPSPSPSAKPTRKDGTWGTQNSASITDIWAPPWLGVPSDFRELLFAGFPFGA